MTDIDLENDYFNILNKGLQLNKTNNIDATLFINAIKKKEQISDYTIKIIYVYDAEKLLFKTHYTSHEEFRHFIEQRFGFNYEPFEIKNIWYYPLNNK